MASENPAGDARVLERLQRRLEAMGKVLSHDFPNQLVIIQGLVQLLRLEESEHVGADAREYLRRLGGACTRALDLAQGLKSIARLGTEVEKSERVALDELAAETAAAIKRLLPDTIIEYHFPQGAGDVSAGRRPLHQALVELVRLAGAVGTGVVLASRAHAGRIEITIAGSAPLSGPNVMESRVEYLLARELVEAAGGILHRGDPAQGRLCAITLPAWV